MGNVASALLGECEGALFDDRTFDDIYEINEEAALGRGKFGQVYLCWLKNDPTKQYALKSIEIRNSDMASVDRIRDEISILQALGSHPGVVSSLDVDESLPGVIRMVMELCDGGELYDRIQKKKRYEEHEAKIVMSKLLEALTFVHQKGIMHRDIKPENILLCSRRSDTDVKISDFGLAKISKNFPERLPRSNSICGSDFYLAPEIIRQEEYGREVDVWALGVVSFVLLSGTLPFYHEVLHKLYRQIVEREMNFQNDAWKHVSKGAMDFILRLLQVRVGERLCAEQAWRHPWLRMTSPHGLSFSAVDEAQMAAAARAAMAPTPSSMSREGTFQHTLAPSDYLRQRNQNNSHHGPGAAASVSLQPPVRTNSGMSLGSFQDSTKSLSGRWGHPGNPTPTPAPNPTLGTSIPMPTNKLGLAMMQTTAGSVSLGPGGRVGRSRLAGA